MSCDLNKFSTYAVGQIVQDDAEGKVLVQLVDPPRTCPDRAFSTHKGMIVVRADAQPSLSWSNTANRPVITVPRRDLIQHVQHPGHGAGFWLLMTLLVAAVTFAVITFYRRWADRREHEEFRRRLDRETERQDARRRRHAEWMDTLKRNSENFNRQEENERELRGPHNRRRRQRARKKQKRLTNQERELLSPGPSYASIPPRPPAPPPTVQHVQHTHVRGSDGFLNGILVNEMLHSHHHDRERIVEREVSTPHIRRDDPPAYVAPTPRYEPPPPPSYSSSDDSYSSSDSSFGSDWGSSFSSDSSSSFDSGSSFSSDSGSTFGND